MSDSGKSAEIHRRVADQYRKFPYPAAEDDLSEFIRNGTYQAGCPSRFFHLYWPFRKKDTRLDILVAGCGTMQAPKFAVNLPGARITAVDLCEDSIHHTNKLLKQHHIRNVDTYRLPLEEIGTLNRSFDLVISTGVLHHLPDPTAGLKALESVLRAEGSMYLMLYGKYGRDGVYYLQDLLRRSGLDASSVSSEQLLAIRQLIRTLPAYHALSAKKGFFRNFEVGDEELVDLFLHPQDRGYSVPDIVEFLGRGGMKLQSMLLRAHYVPACCGIRDSSLMQSIARLEDTEQLAIGELYRAATLMHFFVACKKARDENTFRIDLDAPDWQSLIPAPSPAVLRDTRDLPAGCNAVLYSPIHQFEDLRYPVTAAQLALLTVADNHRTIREIKAFIQDRLPGALDDETVRKTYRELYDYDFVSFRGDDSSGKNS